MTTSTDKPTAGVDLDDWMSQAEAARVRKVSRQAIWRLVQNGRLRTLEAGGHVLVNRSDVESFEPHPPGRPKGTSS